MSIVTAFAAYPEAERAQQVDDYHGTKVSDPYRWMEDVDSPQTRAWVKQEQAFTESWFAKAPRRAAWLQRMKELSNYEQMPLTPGWLRRNHGTGRPDLLLASRRL